MEVLIFDRMIYHIAVVAEGGDVKDSPNCNAEECTAALGPSKAVCQPVAHSMSIPVKHC